MATKRKLALGSTKKDERVPVTLLSGFVGSGKTTILRQLLTNQTGVKCAAIVSSLNDLKDASGVSKTVENSEGELSEVHFSNGCRAIMPEQGIDAALEDLAGCNAFSAVIVENVGTADPSTIAAHFVQSEEDEGEDEGESEGEEEAAAKKQKKDSAAVAAAAPPVAMKDLARLDTCVTVVDASSVVGCMESVQQLSDVELEGAAEGAEHDYDDDAGGTTYVADLLVDLVELADVIVINKADAVPKPTVSAIQGFVETLNPRADVICSSGADQDGACTVPLDKVLGTGRFDVQLSQEPGWLKALRSEASSATPEKTFVFKARKPFHPERLHRWVSTHFALKQPSDDEIDMPEDFDEDEMDIEEVMAKAMEGKKQRKQQEVSEAPAKRQKVQQAYGNIIRSHGTMWLAGRDTQAGEWDGRGPLVRIGIEGPWYTTVEREKWPQDAEIVARIEADMSDDPEIGDRRQEVVFLGSQMDHKALLKDLTACLLTNKEAKQLKAAGDDSELNDPFGEWEDEEEEDDSECEDDGDDDDDDEENCDELGFELAD